MPGMPPKPLDALKPSRFEAIFESPVFAAAGCATFIVVAVLIVFWH